MFGGTFESPVVEHGARRAIISIAVITATLLEIIDVTIVNVSLPNIQGNFGVGVDLGAWVVTAYLIANVVVIPLNPWFAARFGRRQYFFGSICIFTAASLMCGLSNSLGQLVFWRLIQGLGGGGLIATSQAILRDTYGIKEQGKAQGVFALGVIVGPALGPVIGGWITDNWNWHWIFFINIPIGIIAATLIYNFLRNPAEGHYRKLDWIGLILLCIGLGSMQFVLENGQQYDWYDDARIRWFTLTSVVGLAAFVWWTLRSAIPVVDLRVLKLRQVAAGSILGAVLGVSLYGSIIILPQYLINSLGFTATLSGATVMIRAGAVLFFTPLTAILTQRGLVDPRLQALLGFVLLAISNWWLGSITTPVSDFHSLVAPLILSGIGLAQIFVPLSVSVIGSVPDKEVPATAAFFNLSRQIGGSLAAAILITLLVRGFTIHQTELASTQTLARLPTEQFVLGQGGEQNRVTMERLRILVSAQSAVQSYADTSRWVAVITLGLAPLVFLLRRPRIGMAITE
ncbi:MAG: DHA2 family efflux MFS transporter permease subunit [Candidatus Eremiobacteraeota bacterium]|nr:DHA2 family efflux MFS transporter permease subunit [Candidatus Eremiobacteraeota bacterium]MBV8499968.1 DHA2 family efflux MFS transporter permease subunit [Candidatus Eremiobacteraeota bacterium]